MTITPVLLCGGSGTRLWPLSRKSYPKQFTELVGECSLFQDTVKRFSGADYTPPLAITGADFRFIVTEQMAAAGRADGTVLIEPSGRNTAPAILAAALWLQKTDPEGLMLVAPSDHIVPDAGAFHAAVMAGAEAARDGRLVTFGITPDRPETGYGWLELAEKADGSGGPVPLAGFVEKPEEAKAEEMLRAGHFLWNAGIFLFSVPAILAAFERHAPAMMAPVRRAVETAEKDLGFYRLGDETWQEAEDTSIDYAVMEKSENLVAVPYGAGWSDLGDWQSVWREVGPDPAGVATCGTSTAIDCRDTLLRSESEALELVGIGLDNIVAVAMPDAVLIADKSRAQDVKTAVSVLKQKGVRQAEQLPRDYRPWGWFETLILGERFQVKRICVKPGAALSLQSHVHRSEHWVVVSGTAKVTVGDEVKLLTENESVYIPLGAVHRMENPGHVPMVLIEIQTGVYLGEDDIVRYEDVYARN